MFRFLLIIIASRFSEQTAATLSFLAYTMAAWLAGANNLHRDFVLVYCIAAAGSALHVGVAFFRSDQA